MKVRKLNMEYVRSLYLFHYFCSHTQFHLICCNGFHLFENLHMEVSSTGADFQHFVCLFQICLDRVITMRNSELLVRSIDTPHSRNRCIPLHTVGRFGAFESVLAETSNVDWISHLCIVRCQFAGAFIGS